MKNKLNGFMMFVALLFLFSKSSYAYLDPGSGSYLWQLLIAGFLGLAASVKIFWAQIKMKWNAYFSKKDDSK